MNLFGYDLKLWQVCAGGMAVATILVSLGFVVSWARTPRNPTLGDYERAEQLGRAVNVLWLGLLLALPAGFVLAYVLDWAITTGWPQIRDFFANAP